MNLELLQKQLTMVDNSPISRKSDKQLMYYEQLSVRRKLQYAGAQPKAFAIYNLSKNRSTKLSYRQVLEIRQKYNRGIYGKKRLANEYNISVTTIHNIVKNKKRKNG